MFEDFNNPEEYGTPTAEELKALFESTLVELATDMCELQKEFIAANVENKNAVYESLFNFEDEEEVVEEAAEGEENKEGEKKEDKKTGRLANSKMVVRAKETIKAAKQKIDAFKAKIVEFVNKVINYFKMGCKPMDKFLKDRDYELRQKIAKEPNFSFTMHKWTVDEGDKKLLDCMDTLSSLVKLDYVNRMEGSNRDEKLSFPKACGYDNALQMFGSLKKAYCEKDEKVEQVVPIQKAVALLKNRDKVLNSIKAQGNACKTLCNQATALLIAYFNQHVQKATIDSIVMANTYALIAFINKSLQEALHLIDIRKSVYFAMYREYGACLRAYLPGPAPKLDNKTKAVVPVGESLLDDCLDEMDNF